MNAMRPFRMTDLLWLEPLSKKFDEWEGMIRGLETALIGWVVEPLCLVSLYVDDHGICFASINDKAGMKSLIRIGQALLRICDQRNLTVHGHWKEKSWQAELAEHNGFYFDGVKYIRIPFSNGVQPRA